MAGKYSPLETHLFGIPKERREVLLTFSEIEAIIKSKLPTSANDMSWWEHETEGNHINTRAWSNAGWRVDNVNFSEKQVRFVRA